jgi:hypothetical protein
MTHLALRLTARSEARNTQRLTLCLTLKSEAMTHLASHLTTRLEARNKYILPLSGRVLSDYTKLISKVFKLYTRYRFGQHISNLFIYAKVMELQGSSLYHVVDEMIADLYVLRLVMEYRSLEA